MSEHMIPIPSRVYNAAVGGHVAGADQIIDDETGLTLDKVAGGALEEKTYTSGSDDGMGRVVLRKNLVNGVNTLVQTMINKSNTIYVIQYDFTLGENITVPANCVLEFDGGSVSGAYTLTGNNTGINAQPRIQILSSIDIQGTWNVTDIYVEWMNISDTNNCFDEVASICRLQNDSIKQNLFFPAYNLSFTLEDNWLCYVSSNTNIYVPASLSLNANNKHDNGIFYILGKKNVKILGGGNLIGDAGAHDYSTDTSYDNCDGIRVLYAKNVTIENITIEKFIEDGLYLGGGNEEAFGEFVNACEDIYISGVKFDYNCRQGISIVHANNVNINNCCFYNTGSIENHAPGAGVDLEPNNATQAVSNVFIENCTFNYNIHGVLIYFQYGTEANAFKNIVFKNCNIENILGSEYDGEHLIVDGYRGIVLKSSSIIDNLQFENCDIRFVSFDNSDTYTPSPNMDIFFNNCNIYGIFESGNNDTYINGKKLHLINCILTSGKTTLSTTEYNPLYCHMVVEVECVGCTIDYTEFKESGNKYVGRRSLIIWSFDNCDINLLRDPGYYKKMIRCTVKGYSPSFMFIRGETTIFDRNIIVDFKATVTSSVNPYSKDNFDNTQLIISNNSFVGANALGTFSNGYLFRNYTIADVIAAPIIYVGNRSAQMIVNKSFGQYIIDHYTGSYLDSAEPFDDQGKLVFWRINEWVDATGATV